VLSPHDFEGVYRAPGHLTDYTRAAALDGVYDLGPLPRQTRPVQMCRRYIFQERNIVDFIHIA
jgi:hypothetical protein